MTPGVKHVADLAEWTPVALACGWVEPPPYVDERRPHWVARLTGSRRHVLDVAR